MPIDYKAKENDDVLQLAGQHGLPFEKIWDHPKNKSLKDTRSPNQLLKGDILHIPDKEIESETGATESMNSFVLKTAKTKLKLRVVGPVEDDDGDEVDTTEPWEYASQTPSYAEIEPRGKTPYALYLDGSLFKEGETDGGGFIDCQIPSRTKKGVLRLNPGTELESELELYIGGIDPIDTPSGIAKRLSNLGFACNEQAEDFDDDLGFAISNFQRVQNLEPTGDADDDTKSLLTELHGC
ncbi:MAG: peptidoglycan-binding domain-containing protein [Verrucomicrobiia bacterium]